MMLHNHKNPLTDNVGSGTRQQNEVRFLHIHLSNRFLAFADEIPYFINSWAVLRGLISYRWGLKKRFRGWNGKKKIAKSISEHGYHWELNCYNSLNTSIKLILATSLCNAESVRKITKEKLDTECDALPSILRLLHEQKLIFLSDEQFSKLLEDLDTQIW